jgi:hypothetical protein
VTGGGVQLAGFDTNPTRDLAIDDSGSMKLDMKENIYCATGASHGMRILTKDGKHIRHDSHSSRRGRADKPLALTSDSGSK